MYPDNGFPGEQAPAQRLPRAVVAGERNVSVKQLRLRLAAVTSIQRTRPFFARSRPRPCNATCGPGLGLVQARAGLVKVACVGDH